MAKRKEEVKTAAATLGKLGGKARAATLSAAKKKKIAAKGAKARKDTYGALWLCYHALKNIEWSELDWCHECNSHRDDGHDRDCMVGNALRGVEEIGKPRGRSK